MGIFVFIVIVVVVIGAFIATKVAGNGSKDSETRKIQSLNVEPEQRTRKSSASTQTKASGSKTSTSDSKSGQSNIDHDAEQKAMEREKELAFYAAKKSMYQYINQSIKVMNQAYKKGAWESLTTYTGPEADVMDHYDQIMSELSKKSSAYLSRYFSCVDIVSNEDTYTTKVKNSEGLKEFYFGTMLPFYELYASILDEGLRYNSLLGKDVLALFHELTGKKFRIGYKNKYASGVVAYDLGEKDHYAVYASSGKLLCDADFEGRKIKTGYAIVPVEEKSEEDWDVAQEGQWQDGNLVNCKILYNFKKTSC